MKADVYVIHGKSADVSSCIVNFFFTDIGSESVKMLIFLRGIVSFPSKLELKSEKLNCIGGHLMKKWLQKMRAAFRAKREKMYLACYIGSIPESNISNE